MKKAIEETNRRRQLQLEYNRRHQITPRSIIKRIDEVLASLPERDYLDYTRIEEEQLIYMSKEERQQRIEFLEKEMKKAAQNLEFERAAALRDELKKIRKMEIEIGP